MRLHVIIGLSFAFSFTANAQFIGPSAYQSASDSPFAGTTFAYSYLEDCEDGSINIVGMSLSGGSVLAPGSLTDSVDADDGLIDGLGTAGRSWYSTAGVTSLDVSFDEIALGGLPTHAGLVWTDVGNVFAGDFGSTSLTFEAFDESGASLGAHGPYLVGDGSVAGDTLEDRFFGFIHLAGISRIRLSLPNSGDWEVDHIQFARVPEPSSVALLALGGAAVWFFRRGRR